MKHVCVNESDGNETNDDYNQVSKQTSEVRCGRITHEPGFLKYNEIKLQKHSAYNLSVHHIQACPLLNNHKTFEMNSHHI